MKLETFFEKFELFSEAPAAVGRLRELVLELGIRGRLVCQNIADEPSSDLLKRILAEKNRLGARVELTDKEPATISTEEYFEIPANWIWVSATTPVVMVSDQGRKIQTKDILNSGKYPVVDQGKVFVRGYSNNSEMVISVSEPLVIFGDHTREIKLIDFDFIVGADGVKLLQPICIEPRYYFLALRWLPLESLGYSRHFKLLKVARIPLPPLAEQKRIVAKVDELMALCDQLEAQHQEREARRAKLAHASLARFAEAPTLTNLAHLFHTSYAITPADLRKSILALAVQGKLVAQDPNDKPADELIAHIERERVQLAKEQDVRIPKNVPPLNTDDHPHDIPGSWRWSRIGHLALVIDYGTSEKAGNDSSKVPVYRMGNIACGRLIEENLKYVDATINDLPGLYLKTSDILFNRTNSYDLVGKTCIYNGPNYKATFASYLIRIRLPVSMLFPSFFSAAMNAPYYRQTQIEPEIVQQCGQANFNGTKLAATLIPVPPLAEQSRIVAKVDELMALVDQLETQLAKAKLTSIALLDAAIHELLNPSTNVIAFPAAQATTTDRAGIGCYVVQKLAGHKTFGRVALMKHEYLAEAHVGVNLDGQYQRQAAGPLDSWVYRFEEDAAREDWFTVEETKTRDGHKKIVYRKGAELDAKASAAFVALPQAQRDELDRMLKLLGGKPTEDVEIIATLFAVWNDFLIDRHSPNDEDIVTGFREHWHEKKQKFTAKSLHTWLDWMRRNHLVPTGRGPRTQQHPKLDLH
jgi:type I restriction enzyme, S subunit